MRVLLSAYACEPNRGSEHGNGWNWPTHLAAIGHEVWVLTRPRSRAAIQQQLAAHPIPNLHPVYVDIPPAVKPLLHGLPGVYIQYFLWQRAAYQVARALDVQHSFDVIHHVTWSSLMGGSLLWRLGKPFVFGPVGGGQTAPAAFKAYFNGQWRQEGTRNFLTRYVVPFNFLTRQLLRAANMILATNEDTVTLARRMGANNVQLFLDTGLPDHFFLDRSAPTEIPFPSSASQRELKILWTGRLYPRKALSLTLDVLSRVRVPFTLTILGDGPQGASLPDWIQSYGLDGNVNWRGRVAWSEVQEAYWDHDLFLFTSLRDSCAAQLLEAMANGLPIVTLDLHGARHLVPDAAGVKVAVASPEETVRDLAHAVEDLFHHPEKRVAMRQAGLEAARAHEWSRRATTMSNLYQTLV